MTGIFGSLRYVIAAIVAVLLVVAVVYGIRWVTADARGASDAREQTRADGTYRIAAYEQFFDDCAAIQALEDQIETMKADKSLPASQRDTNVLALTNQRNTLIRGYNADAQKSDTRGHFLASGLPYEIDKDEENTECVVAE